MIETRMPCGVDTDLSYPKEKVPLKADLFAVLALPQPVVDHIKNLKDSSGHPLGASQTVAALVGEICKKAGIVNPNAEVTLVLETMHNKLLAARDSIGSDPVAEIMRVPKNLELDIQRITFGSDAMRKGMKHVKVDFPSNKQRSADKQEGRETVIRLLDNEDRVLEEVLLNDRLKVIMDVEAIR